MDKICPARPNMIGQSLQTLENSLKRPFKAPPADGIYYVVRYPKGWELEFVRTSDAGQEWAGEHSAWWVEELANKLAVAWAPQIKTNFSYIAHQLKESPHAFPRGRIELQPSTVFWGDNMTAQMGIDQSDILRAFGLQPDDTVWRVSRWEVVNQEDRDVVRKLLGIQEDWLADKK
jgi:hypothetical protein